MAGLLLPTFALRYTGVQAVQLTAVFLGFSLTAVACGIPIQKTIEYTATELF